MFWRILERLEPHELRWIALGFCIIVWAVISFIVRVIS